MKDDEKVSEDSEKKLKKEFELSEVNNEETKVEETEKVVGSKSYKGSYILVGVVIGIVALLFLLAGTAFVSRVANRTYFNLRRETPTLRHQEPFDHREFRNSGKFFTNNQISGKVTTVNGQTFTVDVSGQSKTVQISDSTRFPLDSAASVKAGDQVVVWGEQNRSGVIQAIQISVNP